MVLVPGNNPLTSPVLLTVAFNGLLLYHVPPVTESVKVIEDPAHTPAAPVITPALGNGFMVIVLMATEVPQTAVTE